MTPVEVRNVAVFVIDQFDGIDIFRRSFDLFDENVGMRTESGRFLRTRLCCVANGCLKFRLPALRNILDGLSRSPDLRDDFGHSRRHGFNDRFTRKSRAACKLCCALQTLLPSLGRVLRARLINLVSTLQSERSSSKNL